MLKKLDWGEIFFLLKLLIMNALIFVCIFYLKVLVQEAIKAHDDVMLGIIVSGLGTPSIGLISLEIHLIFKHLKWRKEFKLKHDEKNLNKS